MKNRVLFRKASHNDYCHIIEMSKEWEHENSCRGYCRDDEEYLEKYMSFVAIINNNIVGYLLGNIEKASKNSSIMNEGSLYFEIDELFIKKEYRGNKIGGNFFQFIEQYLKELDIDMIILSTATKDYKKILHFYIEEMGMEFWHARLFKKL